MQPDLSRFPTAAVKAKGKCPLFQQGKNVPFEAWYFRVRVSVIASARGRAQADAQSRGDGAGSGVIGGDPCGLAAVRGFCFSEIILVKSSERRLWASKRENRRAMFARRS